MAEDWAGADQELEALRNRVDTLIDHDFKVAESTADPQQTIFHYTDVKGALGIVTTGRLWFTERAHMNDPGKSSLVSTPHMSFLRLPRIIGVQRFLRMPLHT
jgi:hypothetical protein